HPGEALCLPPVLQGQHPLDHLGSQHARRPVDGGSGAGRVDGSDPEIRGDLPRSEAGPGDRHRYTLTGRGQSKPKGLGFFLDSNPTPQIAGEAFRREAAAARSARAGSLVLGPFLGSHDAPSAPPGRTWHCWPLATSFSGGMRSPASECRWVFCGENAFLSAMSVRTAASSRPRCGSAARSGRPPVYPSFGADPETRRFWPPLRDRRRLGRAAQCLHHRREGVAAAPPFGPVPLFSPLHVIVPRRSCGGEGDGAEKAPAPACIPAGYGPKPLRDFVFPGMLTHTLA